MTTSNTGGNDDYGVRLDFTIGGDADLRDHLYFTTLHGGSSPRADVTGSTSGGSFDFGRPNSAVDSDDSTSWSGLSAQPAKGRNKLSSYSNAADLRNRKGLAGYEWDPAIKRYHVRNRVLDPEIGRWTRRDPLGYVDGANLYAAPMTLVAQDPRGLLQIVGQPPKDSVRLRIDQCTQGVFEGIVHRNGNRGLDCKLTLRAKVRSCCTTYHHTLESDREAALTFQECTRAAVDDYLGCGEEIPDPEDFIDPDVLERLLPRTPPTDYDCWQRCAHAQLRFMTDCYLSCPQTSVVLCTTIAAAAGKACLWDCAFAWTKRKRRGVPAEEVERLRERAIGVCDDLGDLQDLLDKLPKSGQINAEN